MIGFSANEIFFNFGKKNPIQIYFRSFMQIKCLGEYVCAVLLSHSFPLCPSLGNGAGTERLPLNLLLGKQFSNRKRRFHRIRFGFLELFPGEEFLTENADFTETGRCFGFVENAWLLVFAGEIKELIALLYFDFLCTKTENSGRLGRQDSPHLPGGPGDCPAGWPTKFKQGTPLH